MIKVHSFFIYLNIKLTTSVTFVHTLNSSKNISWPSIANILNKKGKKRKKISVSRLDEREDEGPVSVNAALEKERAEKTKKGGIQQRDPKIDKEPIVADDLGLDDTEFLLDRKVHKNDLKKHIHIHKKNFLGSNVRKPRDFAAIFAKGKSSPEAPKIDLAYDIQQNPNFKRELIAMQLLRNYQSKDMLEERNAEKILKSLKLLKDEDFVDELESDKKAYKNKGLIGMIASVFPKL